MAVVRDIEPWDALLQAGRDDERLVMQAAQNRRAAQVADLPPELHPEVAAALRARGIKQLWSHQAEALHAAWAGPTIVTTGTASGKSLCFQLPTLDTLCRDSRARALYLYPAKALAQDQARALHGLGVERARPAIYDGDTPREQRAQIRRRANVVLTNPDMLHLGILPNHPAWADVFANLALVVVVEAGVMVVHPADQPHGQVLVAQQGRVAAPVRVVLHEPGPRGGPLRQRVHERQELSLVEVAARRPLGEEVRHEHH